MARAPLTGDAAAAALASVRVRPFPGAVSRLAREGVGGPLPGPSRPPRARGRETADAGVRERPRLRPRVPRARRAVPPGSLARS